MLMAPATRGLLSIVGIAPVFTLQPQITGNSIGPGTASSIDTLSIQYAVSGQPAPAITYQWKSGAAVISVSPTLNLTSWGNNVITCVVTAQNRAGLVSVTTTSVFVQQYGGG